MESTRFLLKQEFRKRRNWVNLPFLRTSSHLSGVEERFSRYRGSQIPGQVAWISPIGVVLMGALLSRWRSPGNFGPSLVPSGGSGVPARTACLSFDIKPGFFSPNQIQIPIVPQGGNCAPRRKLCPKEEMVPQGGNGAPRRKWCPKEEMVPHERNGTPVIQSRRPFAPCRSRSSDRRHATESSVHTSRMAEAVLPSRRRGIDAYRYANWNVFF